MPWTRYPVIRHPDTSIKCGHQTETALTLSGANNRISSIQAGEEQAHCSCGRVVYVSHVPKEVLPHSFVDLWPANAFHPRARVLHHLEASGRVVGFDGLDVKMRPFPLVDRSQMDIYGAIRRHWPDGVFLMDHSPVMSR